MGIVLRTTTTAIAAAAVALGGVAMGTSPASAGTALTYQKDGFDLRVAGGPKLTVVFTLRNNSDRGVTCRWTVSGEPQPHFVALRGTREERSAKVKNAGDHKVSLVCESDSGAFFPPKYRIAGSGPVTVEKAVIPLAPKPKPKPKPLVPKKEFDPKIPFKPNKPAPKPKTPLQQILEAFGS